MPLIQIYQQDANVSDEELMLQLASGRQDALGPLYSRYATLFFNMAAQALDRAEAEEVVQDVFLSIWRHAATFNPELGSARSWALQIAHYRIANELRRKRRRPQTDDGAEPETSSIFLTVSWTRPIKRGGTSGPGFFTKRCASYRRCNARPWAWRSSMSLRDPEVAARLEVPLGTAKSRIRDGLHSLRGMVAAAVAALALATAGMFAYRYQSEQSQKALDDRALALVTNSETQSLRLTAGPDAGLAYTRGLSRPSGVAHRADHLLEFRSAKQ